MSKRQRMVDGLKNILIVALLCSAVWLLVDGHLFGGLSDVLNSDQTALVGAENEDAQGQVVLPLGVAVTGNGGVYAAQYDSGRINELFRPLLPILGEVLAGAGQSEPVTRDRWLAALAAPGGVWIDLRGSVPMQVLGRWVSGVDNPRLTGNARQLLLCIEQNGVQMYYWQDSGTCFACRAEGVDTEYLTELLAQNEPDGSAFAAARAEYRALAPQTLILQQLPPMVEYLGANPLAQWEDEPDLLLESLGFAPEITTVYQTPEGRRARSGNDTLTVSDGGVLTFERSGDEQRYPLTGDTTEPEVWRAVDTARQLVCRISERWCNEEVYLRDVRKEQDGWHVQFGYVLNGTPVQLGAQGWAAYVVVDPEGIARYEIGLRRYEPTQKNTLLLPQIQAAAVLEQMGKAGSELVLNYLDGSEQVRAGWIAD